MRTRSRWKGLLIALSLAPLLASVVVRTYGWYIILNRFGVANDALLGLGIIDERIAFMPSTGAIIIGLAHALLPYAVLTIMGSLNGINPNLESAAMSLGANRTRTFFHVVLPLSLPGIAGGFILVVLDRDQRLRDAGDPRRARRRRWRRPRSTASSIAAPRLVARRGARGRPHRVLARAALRRGAARRQAGGAVMTRELRELAVRNPRALGAAARRRRRSSTCSRSGRS